MEGRKLLLKVNRYVQQKQGICILAVFLFIEGMVFLENTDLELFKNAQPKECKIIFNGI